MPELPEVETLAAHLRKANLLGQRIKRIEVRFPKLLDGCTVKQFQNKLIDQEIIAISRRGKFLVFAFSGQLFLLVHLRMSGHFFLKKEGAEKDQHEHLIFSLENHNSLRYRDTRKFGRFYLVSNPELILGKLGPEPLDSDQFTPHYLLQALHKKRTLLKRFLLDQGSIAGLGNIYVDESLWQAKLHPLLYTIELNLKDAIRLHQSIQEVLKKGIAWGGTSLGRGTVNFHHLDGNVGSHQNQLMVYGRADLPCLRCGAKIQKIKVVQRSTHFCPNCQQRYTDS